MGRGASAAPLSRVRTAAGRRQAAAMACKNATATLATGPAQATRSRPDPAVMLTLLDRVPRDERGAGTTSTMARVGHTVAIGWCQAAGAGGDGDDVSLASLREDASGFPGLRFAAHRRY